MRMKKILPFVISEHQSAFIPNTMIQRNVLAAFEIIHCLKRMGKWGRNKLALKLDMAKVYLLIMEIPTRFVTLVTKCVTAVLYFFFLNGKPHWEVAPSQGIRQGDPHLPIFFLIVSEGLSSMLQRAKKNSLIHGISIVARATSINHLFFTNDSLIFCDVTPSKVGELERIFQVYKGASRKQIISNKLAVKYLYW